MFSHYSSAHIVHAASGWDCAFRVKPGSEAVHIMGRHPKTSHRGYEMGSGYRDGLLIKQRTGRDRPAMAKDLGLDETLGIIEI